MLSNWGGFIPPQKLKSHPKKDSPTALKKLQPTVARH
jgi:hypothetical protein